MFSIIKWVNGDGRSCDRPGPRPLNRTQQPRLINMHQSEAEKIRKTDFLTKVHDKWRLLSRERNARSKAMMHWFSRGQDDYESIQESNDIMGNSQRVFTESLLDYASGVGNPRSYKRSY